MTADAVQRKLAALLSADVVGYSRLMAQDEVATLATCHVTVLDDPLTELVCAFALVLVLPGPASQSCSGATPPLCSPVRS